MPAPFALPGLYKHRTPLRRPRCSKRTSRLETGPNVVHAVHLGGVGENTKLLVHEYGALLPGIPKSERHLHELVGHVVAFVVLQVFGEAKILRLGIIERGDDVPRGPTLGEMVDAGK